MTGSAQDGKQFTAESQVLDEEERVAREVLERKAQERAAAKAQADDDAPVVINDDASKPEDDPLHMELQQHAEQGADGELYDKRDGKLLEWNDAGLLRHAPEWQFRDVTFKGYKWEYRDPKKLALMFMSLSSNTKTSPKRRMEAMLGFLEHCLSDRSMDKMIARAFDHDDEFDTAEMGKLMQYVTSQTEGDQDKAELNRAQKRAAGELSG